MRLRAGWTLHELVISLGVSALIIGLAVHLALGQLRFYRGIGDAVAIRQQLAHASGIAVGLLWGVSPPGGDIAVALDTAIEVELATGAAVACESSPGRIAIPAPAGPAGNVLAAYAETPEFGDRVLALLEDSIAATWVGFRAASSPRIGGRCALFPEVATTWVLDLQESVTVPQGTALRFTRPWRLSLYKASDSRWYLGARDWNAAAQRFNGIQPVAGPLRSFSPDMNVTGLLFSFFDRQGIVLTSPADTRQIAAVRVVTRGLSSRPMQGGGLASQPDGLFADSLPLVRSLRNAR